MTLMILLFGMRERAGAVRLALATGIPVAAQLPAVERGEDL
jgi:hypothetical protein